MVRKAIVFVLLMLSGLNAFAQNTTCNVQVLNEYEINADHKVYIFNIPHFEKDSAACWWAMFEYASNYQAKEQVKYEQVTIYFLDIDYKRAGQYGTVTEKKIEKHTGLQVKTIAKMKVDNGVTNFYMPDPFKLAIYKDPRE